MMMGDGAKQMLARPIQLADQVSKCADGAQTCRPECADLKSKSERLASLFRQAARIPDLYDRPARRIMAEATEVLERALALALRCRSHGLVQRVLTLAPPAAFKKTSAHLDNSLADLSWLLRASEGDGDSSLLGLPPVAQNDPILFLIWSHVAALLSPSASLETKSDSAAALLSLARGSGRHAALVVAEDGVGPLLRLVKEGSTEGQENAARALGILAREPEGADAVLGAGAPAVFFKVLKDGPMRAQAMVAWAVGELASCHPVKFQEAFAQHNVVRQLVGLLAFETVEEHSKYTVVTGNSMHSVILAAKASTHHSPLVSHSVKARELENPATKARMKAMAAWALCQLARGNSAICKSITESRALLCFAVLLEKGATDDIRLNSAMALMEIARVAEHNSDLRRTAFKPTSPAAKAVVDQLIKAVDRAEGDLLLPCVTALGCLSRTFRTSETRLIDPLVRLLDEKEGAVSREAAVALTKFACTENHLHDKHCRAVIAAGGAEHLVQLVYLGKQAQVEALVLLCYVALHLPDGEELAKAGVPAVLAWASKQGHMVQDTRVDSLLPEAQARLELYQSRGPTGFH